MEHTPETEHFLRRTFTSILANSPDLMFIKDTDLRYVVGSRSFADMLGLEHPDMLVGKTDSQVFEAGLARRYVDDDRRVLETGKPMLHYVEPLPECNGERRYGSSNKYPILDEHGVVIGLYGVSRDVTAQRELEEEREYRTLSHTLFEGVLEADITENRTLRSVGGTWGDRLEVMQLEQLTQAVKAMAECSIHPDYAEEFQSFYCLKKLAADYANGIREFSHITYQTDDGVHYKWIEFRSRLYTSTLFGTLRMVTFVTDLDCEIRAQAQLKRRAETDPLTGLLNRESTLHQIDDCIGRCSAGKAHALMFIDLDYFKQVNDTLGHCAGDLLLQEVAGALKTALRQNDIVGRIGGDEFLVLLKNVSCKEDAAKKAQEVFALIPRCQVGQDEKAHVTCSVGVTMCGRSKLQLEQLIEQADKAMYRAKEKGRNCISFF